MLFSGTFRRGVNTPPIARPFALALVALMLGSVAAHAVELQPGDYVMLAPDAGPRLWRIDPATFQRELIASHGLIGQGGRIAVDARDRIYVPDQTNGIVEVDAATGSQTQRFTLAELGNRVPRGLCIAPNGGLYVAAGDAILWLDVAAHQSRVVTSGGWLSEPHDVDVGPDGRLYVAEFAIPLSTASPPWRGSIVRVDPSSGAQTRVAEHGNRLLGPFDIEVAPDGFIWTANRGYVSGREGAFCRTDPNSGVSVAVSQGVPGYSSMRSQALTIGAHGELLLADCLTVGPNCATPFLYLQTLFPNGPTYPMPVGPIATAPAGATSTRAASWGRLKTRYR
ncbi:MAG: hypothetical protein HOP12_00425 [Candidatus Eisenbacteria bacterium]|uniref:SMP-30/Gluconolactonase/LRE-like region domain-containing protein n=1 Tax=Eiseniibacteriota bacterium TaxID=2212470 RepID=A0A849SE14_UNCEI|nr:hypothetical protein [Candidatus Eisenbacteria bacterium]